MLEHKYLTSNQYYDETLLETGVRVQKPNNILENVCKICSEKQNDGIKCDSRFNQLM